MYFKDKDIPEEDGDVTGPDVDIPNDNPESDEDMMFPDQNDEYAAVGFNGPHVCELYMAVLKQYLFYNKP